MLFLLWRYLNFCSDFFDLVEKRRDKKAEVSFKIYDVNNWETNYKTCFVQEVKAIRQ